jgi:hypothetical protein
MEIEKLIRDLSKEKDEIGNVDVDSQLSLKDGSIQASLKGQRRRRRIIY